MTSKEVILRSINFDAPERLGFDYYAYGERDTDIATSYLDWECRYEKKTYTDDKKEYYTDEFGNWWARVITDKSTKGEIHKGVLDNWRDFENYQMPNLSGSENFAVAEKLFSENKDKFLVGCLPNYSFTIVACMRGFSNLMLDLALEKERLKTVIGMVEDEMEKIVFRYAECGADAIHVMEDWGTQRGMFMSLEMWNEFFRPGYERLCQNAHSRGLKVILHSCGQIYELINTFIAAGIDVLQFDQTAIYASSGKDNGIERLNEDFGGRVTFFCPVDIQQTLITGNKKKIEDEAYRLVMLLGNHNGGFIAKSYGRGTKQYLDAIGCSEESNNYAYECFKKSGQMLYGPEVTRAMGTGS